MNTPPSPGADTRASATRERILDATRAAVVEHGISAVSMVEIARLAGVGRTTLYRNWSDIRTLLTDLLTREATTVLADAGIQAADARELADSVLAVSVELRSNPVLTALVEHEPEIMATYVFRRFGRAQQVLIEVFRSHIDRLSRTDPALAGRDPVATATMLMLVVQGGVLSHRLAATQMDDATWRSELEHAVTGFLGVAQGPRPSGEVPG